MLSPTAEKLANSSLAQPAFPGALWMAAVISWCTLNGCCYFLVHFGWLRLFLGVLYMVGVISWYTLDGCGYFSVYSTWLVLFPGAI